MAFKVYLVHYGHQGTKGWKCKCEAEKPLVHLLLYLKDCMHSLLLLMVQFFIVFANVYVWQITQWISTVIKDGDTRNIPFFVSQLCTLCTARVGIYFLIFPCASLKKKNKNSF